MAVSVTVERPYGLEIIAAADYDPKRDTLHVPPGTPAPPPDPTPDDDGPTTPQEAGRAPRPRRRKKTDDEG